MPKLNKWDFIGIEFLNLINVIKNTTTAYENAFNILSKGRIVPKNAKYVCLNLLKRIFVLSIKNINFLNIQMFCKLKIFFSK